MVEPILEIQGVRKTYPARRSLFGRSAAVDALKGVSLAVTPGESFGLVGESGSGKTTLTRSILRLEAPTAGRILFKGEDMARLGPKALRTLRARIQIVFQDPYASLNPRMTVEEIVSEPMLVHRDILRLDRAGRRDRAAELLALVGLSTQHLARNPHEFSGGQRQRIGIARALAAGPELLLLDEPTSALDVSVQAQVLNLLIDLQDRLGLTYLFISHDLAVVRYLCDRVALIHSGVLVEEGPTREIFDAPQSDYARMLLGAAPKVRVPPATPSG
ncbi:ATP-binding cassette domain-containing protein [Mangrovibrevibacter kandeliae]|uniref:ATP-binding cassette domain-containing protein n=1 Tax=Mangrovibrevibacter kandeliae TaxID=2968473 RepID=UPI002118F414|nr:ATP-binding cassette domain-containing protein [Aurantimonas sp. CSK15Z-1]MCQ8781588.1 ATP-binding cassette domain-containing protein [Aurantimonas sp. CSK15Z-1]